MNKIITKSKSTTTAKVTYIDGTSKELVFTGKSLELKDLKLKALKDGKPLPVAYETLEEKTTVYYVPENVYIENAIVETDLKVANSSYDMYRTTSGCSATAIICDSEGNRAKKTFNVSTCDTLKALKELILQGVNVVEIEQIDTVDKKYYCMSNERFFELAKVKTEDINE